MPKIHPTAIISPTARLADDVEVGAYAIIEDDVAIGAGSVVRPHAVVRKFTSMGQGNFVDSYAVLGGLPQDLKFDPLSLTYLKIGDGNIFRENVTISRATTVGGATVIGNRNYFMVGSHAGHDSLVGNDCIFVNGSALAGHTTVENRVILSAHVVIHQFCWIGEMAMSQGQAAASMHVPPYVTIYHVNCVSGLNVVGLRRNAEITGEDRRQIKEAFAIAYRAGLPISRALEKMDACTDWGAPATKFRSFIRKAFEAKKPFNRGLIHLNRPKLGHEQEE